MDIPICSIKKGTALCRVIQEGKATVVDEAPMTNKLAFEALDLTLRDLQPTDGRYVHVAVWGLPTNLASYSGWN